MEWQATYLGKTEVQNVVIDDPGVKPDLTEEATQAAKEIRKSKRDTASMTLSVKSEALCADPISDGSPIYQPIGKIVFVNAHAEGALKKAHLFTYISCDEGCRIGGPSAKYTCYVFKCKNDQDSNAIAFATARTMAANAQRRDKVIAFQDGQEDWDLAVKYWNANNPRLHHFDLAKDDKISGNLKVLCQSSAGAKAIVKVVRLTSLVKGDELVSLLVEKFNLGSVDTSLYAVFLNKDTGEQDMLTDDQSPITLALHMADPAEASFVLRKLSPGLVRVSKSGDATAATVTSDTTASQAVSASAVATPKDRRHSNTSGLVLQGLAGESSTDDEPTSRLGPLLPYHEDDEDLLLNVMITKQTGNGLGFKLTPAYLLQMCIAFCALKQGTTALKRLLGKIANLIEEAVQSNLGHPDLLLFWASNSLKLTGSLLQDPGVFSIFSEHARPKIDATVDKCLHGIDDCAKQGEHPAELTKRSWSNHGELRANIVDYYRTMDQHMSPDSLRDVVNRITEAMPKNDIANGANQGDTTQRLGFTSDDAPLTSTPVANGRRAPGPDLSGHPGAAAEDASAGDEDAMPPLPDEWEELIDQDTKHRFFANHKTRQTSWTDPRDKLVTVNLVKGGKGLGLGISGAKRTRDGRLVLGIFVSSLVPGSAADVDGTLRDGDEILEVNGHSLIGVSREGAIDFLKNVQHGETISLLVAQEPVVNDNKMKHTQL
eukprot:TRINITY_DN4919_c0_g1_i1.p1 TRINITY_DN4919_c0_g1~~TRINITY_DN4919_c0_g1_i1.p1  ORF type:complete len:714 (+),score=177.96 TRINITY_DN4919_c0_g1_i1:166-2307(+)